MLTSTNSRGGVRPSIANAAVAESGLALIGIFCAFCKTSNRESSLDLEHNLRLPPLRFTKHAICV